LGISRIWIELVEGYKAVNRVTVLCIYVDTSHMSGVLSPVCWYERFESRTHVDFLRLKIWPQRPIWRVNNIVVPPTYQRMNRIIRPKALVSIQPVKCIGEIQVVVIYVHSASYAVLTKIALAYHGVSLLSNSIQSWH